MNRKGADTMIKLLVVVFFAIVAILIGVWVYNKIQAGSGSIAEYLKDLATGDFDNDGQKNPVDPCPCGGPNTMETMPDGSKFCAVEFDYPVTGKSNEQICGCANKLANIVAKKEADYTEDKSLFIWKAGEGTLPGRCLYTVASCRYLMKETQEFYGDLAGGKYPC
jgi:hypothetical protein